MMMLRINQSLTLSLIPDVIISVPDGVMQG